MNQLPTALRAQALHLLVEGSSMRSISCVLGISFNAVAKLLKDAGEACGQYHDQAVRNVTAQNIQCDEIWAFCAEQQTVIAELRRRIEELESRRVGVLLGGCPATSILPSGLDRK